MSDSLPCVVFFLLFFGYSAHCSQINGTVYLRSTNCVFVPGKMDVHQGDAYGTYNNTISQSGWAVLNIKAGHGANPPTDSALMFAAGCLEGSFTADTIYNHYHNIKSWVDSRATKGFYPKLQMFFDDQEKWTNHMVQKFQQVDPFWRQTGNLMMQFDGLVAGYNMVADDDKKLDRFAFKLLNGIGDVIDLLYALSPESRPDFDKMTSVEFERFFSKHGHCSALIKVTPAFENIFMSHSSWFTYAATLRIYKHYNFNLADSSAIAKSMSFSSYPGFLESLDDFYILGSQLVMLQTTNNVFNHDLYKTVTPESLLAWQRVRLANLMANNGSAWANVFKRYNSGTYNNQYMILDLKKIKLNEAIMDDALWVVEQIPTFVMAADQSAVLRAGYWPSYNVPFYENIYNMSGYPSMVKKFGTDYSYQLAPRAKIFRRDQSTVNSMNTFKAIMRYNDYLHDPYAEGNPCNAICCREDLRNKDPVAGGCYDTKVTDYNNALQFMSEAINGPTLGTGLPPFKWTSGYKVLHNGLPPVYNFTFVPMKPSLN